MSLLAPDDLFDEERPRGDRTLTIVGAEVPVTTLQRVYFSRKRTKADLLRYYHRVAPVLLPHLRDRPMVLKRFPQGAGGPSFFQHEAGDVPPFVRTQHGVAESGKELDYVIGGDEPTLLYFASRGAIECHTWHATVDSLDHPDRMVIDLDPGPRIPFSRVCALALAVREVLAKVGLVGYAKTSGSRGMHVFVPLKPDATFDDVADAAQHFATTVVASHPKHATIVRDPDDRPSGTVYVDYLQNARGKSVASPYSVRANPRALVSTPLTWDEVEAVPDRQSFTISTVPERIDRVGDLFAGALGRLQTLP